VSEADPLLLQLRDRLSRIDDMTFQMHHGLGSYAAELARECFILRRFITRHPNRASYKVDRAIKCVIGQGRKLCLDDLLAELKARLAQNK